MSHPLDGAWAKLRWAEHHFEALRSAWLAFLEDEAYEFRLDREFEAKTIWVYFRPPPIPPDISLIAGDVVQNVRASLDYVVAELVDANGGNSMRSQFPIYVSERGFIFDVRYRKKTRGTGPLNGIPATSDEWAFVERLQPYQRGRNGKLDPLYALNYLSNRDKHRALSPAFGSPLVLDWSRLFQIAAPVGTRYRWKFLWLPWHPLKHETLLGGIEFTDVVPYPEVVQVDVHSSVPFDVFFDEGVERDDPTQEYGLTRIIEHVRKIIGGAEVFFL